MSVSLPELENKNGFTSFPLSVPLQRGISAAGFFTPRPVQTEAIPEALRGRDILGLAQTGTGKTAAFALPILEHLLASRSAGPRALILAPTRELASQICEEFRMLARFTKIRVATVFGGVAFGPQIAEIRRNPDIVVACPGRLLDLVGQRIVELNRIEILVVDEADHMFDMGFLPDLRRIISILPQKRQNLMFSATMPREIRILADGLLKDPHVVELNPSTPVSSVSHVLYPIGDDIQKFSVLEDILGADETKSAIVFTRTKYRAKRLALKLERLGHNAVALQGNMSQPQRVRAMEGFRRHQFKILVATEIAARGIDVEQVSHVVNFDIPDTPDAYTHRIGRTGRSDKLGIAITFVAPEDAELIRAIEKKIGSPIPRRNAGELSDILFRPRAESPREASPQKNGREAAAGDERVRSRRRRGRRRRGAPRSRGPGN